MAKAAKKTKNKSIPVLFLRDTTGKASASFTIAWLSFNIVFVWLMLFIFGPMMGLVVPAFDAAAAVAFLSPTLGLYFLRRKDAPVAGDSVVEKIKDALTTEEDDSEEEA